MTYNISLTLILICFCLLSPCTTIVTMPLLVLENTTAVVAAITAAAALAKPAREAMVEEETAPILLPR